MKIRSSFVSNSSSSSFVLAKIHMTQEQIDKFRKFIIFLEDYSEGEDDGFYEFAGHDFYEFIKDEYITNPSEGWYPFEKKHYFYGEIDQSFCTPILNFLKSIGVDEDYILI